jgi:hypothetical protein
MEVLVANDPPSVNQFSVQTPYLRVLLQYNTTYIEATEGRPMDGGNDFPLPTNYSTYIFLLSIWLTSRSEKLFGHMGLLHGQRS